MTFCILYDIPFTPLLFDFDGGIHSPSISMEVGTSLLVRWRWPLPFCFAAAFDGCCHLLLNKVSVACDIGMYVYMYICSVPFIHVI